MLSGLKTVRCFLYRLLQMAVAAVVIAPSSVMAFINIEAVRQQQESDFIGKSTLKFAGQSGNTNKLTAAASTLNIQRGVRDEFLLLADYVYAQSLGLRDTNNGRLHLRYTFLSREPLAYETFTQAEFDEFKGLNSRTIGGLNLRHQLLQTEHLAAFLGTGTFYEFEDYTGDEKRNGLRGNFYLSYAERFSERVAGSGVIYYQPSFRGLEDYRIRFQTGLEVMVTSRVSVDLEYSVAYDSFLPSSRVEHTDTSYLVGFSLKY